MNCDEAVEAVMDSLLGERPDEEARRLESHLAGCAKCKQEAMELREAWELVGLVRAETEWTTSVTPVRSRAGNGRLRVVWEVAAALAVFAVGVGVGDRSESTLPEPDGSPAFLLLAHGAPPAGSLPEEVLVGEYAAWAVDLAEAGRLLHAAKLEDDGGEWVASGATGLQRSSELSGYFVIKAPDYAAAAEIARTSPHVRRGGAFEIRRLDSGQ